MGEQIVRTTEGKLKLLTSNNKFLYPVEIWALNEKVNRNGWQYTNISSKLEAFRNIPILIAYEMGGSVVGGGHNFDTRRDKEGKEYVSFTAADAERIVGWVHDKANIRIERDEEGTEWVVMDSYLWAWYSKEAVDAIAAEQGSGMSVSIETLVTDEHMEGDVAVEDEYIVLGITILGRNVQPAVAGAHIKSLSALSKLREEMHENVLKAASYVGDSKNVQENNSNERMRFNMTYFSKKQCAELSKRFDGYTVLAAAQDENGIHVALLSKTGDTARYDMNSVDETIASEKIIACNGSVKFDCDTNCDNAMTVGVDAVIECMGEVVAEAQENCRNAQAAEQKANEALSTAMATIAEMRNAENARRVQSAKACAISTLNAFNANSEFEIPKSALDAINADIDNGVYTERCNAEGKWIGEEEVALRVKALCTDKTIEANNAKAANSKKVYAWERLNDGLEDDGSVAALLKRKGIE